MIENMIKIARGDEKAPLVFKNANIINVFTNEIIKGDVAVYKGKIVGMEIIVEKRDGFTGNIYLSFYRWPCPYRIFHGHSWTIC